MHPLLATLEKQEFCMYYWKKILISIGLLSLGLLTACAQTDSINISPTEIDTPPTSKPEDTGMGSSGGMQHDSGMHARHMAKISSDYAGKPNPILTDDEESLASGKELFEKHCATCHGQAGMGDGPAGVSLDPPASPVAHTSRMMGDDYLFWRISEGGLGAPFNSAMPGWKDILEEQARWQVISHLRVLAQGGFEPGSCCEDPQREERLAEAVDQGVITEQEAQVFNEVHSALDKYAADLSGGFTGRMEDVQTQLLAELVESGVLTQEQVDKFIDIHDRLLEAGVMP
jgi:mono/diheme cytochrome c family protein